MMNALRPSILPLELLQRRLGNGHQLRTDDLARFGRLETGLRTYHPGAELCARGSVLEGPQLVASGFVALARLLTDGRRQIVALRLPGDILGEAGGPQTCALLALTQVQTVDAEPVLAALADPSPRFDPLRESWAADRRDQESRTFDHVLRLGRLSAYERTAHFLLEIHERQLKVGLANPASFHMPLTQEVLADILGLSIVHVNRTLQQLRREGLINYRSGQVTLLDRDRLAKLADYRIRIRPPPEASRLRPARY
jgi:CRP-like cAMP-binding protein